MFVFNDFFTTVAIAFCLFARGRDATKSIKTDGQTLDNVIVRFPYLVGLTDSTKPNRNSIVCTGTLVTSVFVLSSAFCMKPLQWIEIKAYRKVTTHRVEYRDVVDLYIHPMYDDAKRLGDISLSKLEKPFQYFSVGGFVRFTSKLFKNNEEMDCMIVGIGLPDEQSYAVPVRARYGRTACHIPESNPDLKHKIGYTWTEFLCTKTSVDPSSQTSPHLPCDRGDALVCNNQQYGVLSYGYGTTARTNEPATECGDAAVQSRHLFVNRNTQWIADTVSEHTDAGDGYAGRSLVTATMTTVGRQTSRSRTSTLPVTYNNGHDVTPLPESYPYLVYVEGGGPDEPKCGGTLISPLHVLTSAYCTTRMSSIKVYLLTGNEQSTDANETYVHESFNLKTLTADVSVIVLQKPFVIAKYARLPNAFNGTTIQDNDADKLKNCSVMAKRPKSSYHNIPLKIKYGVGACRKALDLEIQKTIEGTWHDFFCGRLKTQLEYDIGSPLICNDVQYGIISHSYQITQTKGRTHGRSVDENRFLSVQNYKPWLDEIFAIQPDANSGSRCSCGALAFVLTSWLMLQLVC